MISDPFSSLTHLAGAIAFAGMGAQLVRAAGPDPGRRTALAVFATGCAFMLALSGCFHLLPRGSEARYLLHMADHAAIFVLIASTFTPIHAILFRGPGRWGVLTAVWTIALAGSFYKVLYFDSVPQGQGFTLYLAFGWLGLASAIALVQRFGYAFVMPLMAGAVVYTVGAVADYVEWPVALIGAHGFFHIAVLIALALHWQFMRSFASGGPYESRSRLPAPVRLRSQSRV
jgi:channel protein (hemolysin III family)